MILLIDNYDSFTYNLYQSLTALGAQVEVRRNDCITVSEVNAIHPNGIVLSPGPGHPDQAGMCVELVRSLGAFIPVLGVCLGHQAIALAFQGRIQQANQPIHGQESLIFHNQAGLLGGLPLPFKAGRYHSLIVSMQDFPNTLQVDGTDKDGEIMALSHRDYPIFGVQFHPESILTPEGNKILQNFMEVSHANS